MKAISRNRESGAVSLFIVIFAMLIITVLTIGFLRIMVTDQNQASDNDLSQSAYDSAQAGVEDAKRALLTYQQACASDQAACSDLNTSLTLNNNCNAWLYKVGVIDPSNVNGGALPATPGEVKVQQSQTSNDKLLDQAYTCVKVTLATNEYEGTLSQGEGQIIPLVGESGFDTVTIRWFSRDDVSPALASSLNVGNASPPLSLPDTWPATRPSVMRAQLIQMGSTFTMGDFDMMSGGQSNTNTVFLYPTTSAAGSNSDTFAGLDTRRTSLSADPDPAVSSLTPRAVRCTADVSAGGYSCQMSLKLPDPMKGGARSAAYLRLSALYNATHYEVGLSNGVNLVKFKDVQPEIDSTGRANDIFRRVVSRVNLYDTTFPYPDATIDITKNFCKDFGVTAGEYIPGSCTP